MNTTLRRVFFAVIAASATAAAHGQPPAQPGATPPEARTDKPEKSFRALLERRIDEGRERLNAFEDALRRIDAGEDPAKVRESLENSAPGGRRMLGSRPFLPERVGEEPRPQGEPGGPPPNAPLTPEERERALGFLEQHLPRVADKMRDLSKSNPATLDRLLMRMRPKLLDLGNAMKYDHELFELKVRELQAAMQVMEAAKALREAATEADRPALRQSLRDAVAEHFDIQLKVSEREAAKLAERIESLRNEIADRKARRDAFIDRELEATLRGPRPGRGNDGPRPEDGSRQRERQGQDTKPK